MDKFFQTLSKPAKWIFVIGGFFYATWFSILQISAIGGTFVSVTANMIIFIIGSALLVAAPILVLMNKKEIAKLVFIFLIGYWLLMSIQTWFTEAEASSELRRQDGLTITISIFAFLAALALTGVLVMIVLGYIFKNPVFRFIGLMIFFGVIFFSFITGILFMVFTIKGNAFWPQGMAAIVAYMITPTIICFGYLYFFGAPKEN